MKERILSQVYQHPLLNPEDIQRLMDAHQPRHFTKGEVLYERGKVLNEYLVLESGLIRSFTHDYHGDEITTDFFGDHEVVIEVLSLFQ
ncbi:cyclic nucleotide-binding domain-containing protein [Sphingobacterium sp. lm-10]|uniref:Crp/Fnr family transcriptional regulator n=1 Tax=Sphingobacterium sp. lm-10 TaxID=2944904 RepID=UPI002020BAA6|nr:cyclic nucleotide-binding domain-containing protein [Sphingobacterium sp. lm-10]MCL7988146.1 cyclic nucleotide-binding domain-containing protein [Sphingobacterium sp. lm-10]